MIDVGSVTAPEEEIDVEEGTEETELLESHEPEVLDSTFSREEIEAIILEFFLKNLELALRGKLGDGVFATLEPQTSQSSLFQLLTPEVEEWPNSARQLLQDRDLRASSYLKRLVLASLTEAVERRLSSSHPEGPIRNKLVKRHAAHIYREAMTFIDVMCQRIQHETTAMRIIPGEEISDSHPAADLGWEVIESTMFSDRLHEVIQGVWEELSSIERVVLIEHLASKWGVQIESEMTDGRPVINHDEISIKERARALSRAKAILGRHLEKELLD